MLFFGLRLVLTQFGLRWLPLLRGAATSIPTTAVMFLCASPFVIEWNAWNVRAVAEFVAVGCLFPAAVTVLTFLANQRIGPTVTAALGNLVPVFAVLLAARDRRSWVFRAPYSTATGSLPPGRFAGEPALSG